MAVFRVSDDVLSFCVVTFLKRLNLVWQQTLPLDGFVGSERYHRPGPDGAAVRMWPDEAEAWSYALNLSKTFGQKYARGSLYVPKNARAIQKIKQGTGLTHEEVEPLAGSGSMWILPRAKIVGAKNRFDSASIDFTIHGRDSQKRWILEEYGGGMVFRPAIFAQTLCWFMSSFHRPNDGNVVTVQSQYNDLLVLNVTVSTVMEAKLMKAPEEQMVHFFFWQMRRFVSPLSWRWRRRGLI